MQVVWIQGLIRELNQLGCKLWLEWVPGHVGLEQNELCDRMDESRTSVASGTNCTNQSAREEDFPDKRCYYHGNNKCSS